MRQVTQWKEIIGNSSQKRIVLDAIRRNALPSFTLFTGNSGIGKSTFAALTAKSLLCMHPDPITGEPCGQCVECLGVDSGESASYKKINMPRYFRKADLDETISEIFKTQKMSARTVYVLEEIHGIGKDLQAMLLEELTKIPKDVFILSCTTRGYTLLPEIFNRAFEIRLDNPTTRECTTLIRSLANDYKIQLGDSQALVKMATLCDNNPRKISELIRVISTDNKLTQKSLDEFFNIIPSEQVVSYLSVMLEDRDLFKFIEILQEIQDAGISLTRLNTASVDAIYRYVVATSAGVSVESLQVESPLKDFYKRVFAGIPRNRLVIVASIFGTISFKSTDSNNVHKSQLVEAKLKLEKLLTKEEKDVLGSQIKQVPKIQTTNEFHFDNKTVKKGEVEREVDMDLLLAGLPNE